MAAEKLSAAGLSVTIYDRMPSPARKFLLAGRGGLNLTHDEDLERFLTRYGPNAERIASIVATYPPADLRRWAEGLGQEMFVGTSGRVFPKALKASPLLRAWLKRLEDAGVTIATRHYWQGWDDAGDLEFSVGGDRRTVQAPKLVVLALGGASWPRLGSDGAWRPVLEHSGVGVTPLAASNVKVCIDWSDVFRRRFEGEPIKRLAITCEGESSTGEAVITRDGFEGNAVYALSRPIRTQLARDGKAQLLVDVRPSFSHEELAAKLAQPRKKQSTATFLRKSVGMAPIAIALTREGAGAALPSDPETLARLIKAIPLTVAGIGDIDRAISTAGGVAFEALDENLMLKVRPGTFVAGEMVDWDAPTGGYLLQATFASAVRASEGAIAWFIDQQTR